MKEHLAAFKALSDITRLRILELLENNKLCGKALASRLKISEAAISQHMQILKDAGIVEACKSGYWIHYTINRQALQHLADTLRTAAKNSCPADHCRRIIAMKTQNRKKEVNDMCQCCCEKPEQLKTEPAECTPEQIRACHGDTQDHPCMKPPKKESPD
uniref:ArsR family transcriptional regulator n=1 Tax=Desulfatirhabdium butyrativorans TaxID=340467 RepID=A0A7C4W155_9BACT